MGCGRRVLGIVAFFVAGCSSGDLERRDNATKFEGLSAPVEIVIDTRGIPHIYARTDAELMYASGYQVATDRLLQLDLVRRRALGRQAELLGADKVGQDELSRLMNFRHWGEQNVERLRADDPDLLDLFEAWVAGVNRRIEQVQAGEVPLPPGYLELGAQPEPITVEQHSAVAKMIIFGQDSNLESELLVTILQRNFPIAWNTIELTRPAFPVATMPDGERPASAGRARAIPPQRAPIPATPRQLRDALSHVRDAHADLPSTASNNWAVDGRHTDNGFPLWAGDPHQPLQSPSVMYAHHLNSKDGDGRFNVAGWAFVGGAGVHMGHNDRIGWTATNNFADVMDIWEVEMTPGGARVGPEVAPVVERAEIIEVAGEAPQTYVVRDVPGHGVILPEGLVPIQIAAEGHALLLGYTGFSATSEEQGFFALALAQDVDEFDAAVDIMEAGRFNFLAADETGISYRVNALVPDRGDPAARPMPMAVVDGDDVGALWSSFLSPDKLPRSRADGVGFIVTANNDPWGFTFDGDVGNDPWYYGALYASGFRAQRIDAELRRLADRGSMTLEDMQALQNDTHSVLADALIPGLFDAHAQLGNDEALAEFRGEPDLETLVDALAAWDRRMDQASPAAVAFHMWIHLLTEEIAADELSLLYDLVLEERAPFLLRVPLLALGGAYSESAAVLGEDGRVLMLRALMRTAELLTQRHGSVNPDAYRWGSIHGTRFDNVVSEQLAVGFVPTAGGEDTVNVSASKFAPGGEIAPRWDSTSGAVFRMLGTFDDDGTPRVFANFPPGNAEDPGDPHFADTLAQWVDGNYALLPFKRAEVDQNAERTVILDPADHPAP